ncbi:MAG: hypothetical protein LBD84_03485 [Campylobacteraceae bacterium]|jgi:galactitol-specific phosphotransferase system IIB component|nr:hypothetical protein [Campylobacteraceae bacterium]
MIIIGHDIIDFKPFCRVNNADEASKDLSGSIVIYKANEAVNIPSGSTLIFKFTDNQSLIKCCRKNGINFAVETESIKEALLANAAGASYIVVSGKDVAKNIQDLAENYLFDAKILLKIKTENEIEEAAKVGIDGVLFMKGIINGDF